MFGRSLLDAVHQLRGHGISLMPVLDGKLSVGGFTHRIVVEYLADPAYVTRLDKVTDRQVRREPSPSSTSPHSVESPPRSSGPYRRTS